MTIVGVLGDNCVTNCRFFFFTYFQVFFGDLMMQKAQQHNWSTVFGIFKNLLSGSMGEKTTQIDKFEKPHVTCGQLSSLTCALPLPWRPFISLRTCVHWRACMWRIVIDRCASVSMESPFHGLRRPQSCLPVDSSRFTAAELISSWKKIVSI